MSRQRTRKPAVGIQLFPFLAVLICTMGALIVLLVLVVSQARVHADAIAENRVQRAAVADVRCVVAMAVAGARFGQRVEVAGVGQAVDIRHRPLGFADDVAHDGRADEARAAGD